MGEGEGNDGVGEASSDRCAVCGAGIGMTASMVITVDRHAVAS